MFFRIHAWVCPCFTRDRLDRHRHRFIQGSGGGEANSLLRGILADTQKAGHHRLGAPVKPFYEAVKGHLTRRLGKQNDHGGLRISLKGFQGAKRGDPANRVRKVPATRANSMGNTRSILMHEAGELLESGPGSADDTNGAAPDNVCKAEANAPDDGRAAVGSHHDQPSLLSILFER